MKPDYTFKCRHCGSNEAGTFVDLGLSPLANAFVPPELAGTPDKRYPLHARVCHHCMLVQVDDVVPAEEIFNHEYAYFSSFSDSWLAHCSQFATAAVSDYQLTSDDLVMEVASNDGYLLQYFKQLGTRVLGIEPAANTAAVAQGKGIPTKVEFFTEALAQKLISEGVRPKLICSANVLAHVPDINDFVSGVRTLLQDDTVYTVEFPQLLSLIHDAQFDTIYHEHFSYLSLYSSEKVLNAAGLRVFNVESLPTHGGSLRLHVCLMEAGFAEHPGVELQRARERHAGLDSIDGYIGFAPQVAAIRDGLQSFLTTAQQAGRKVAAYGAAAKGNTLLNYCGVGTDLIRYVVDRNPAKQGTLLPGSRIPVREVSALYDDPVDDVLILPWNIKDEILDSLSDLSARGTRFHIPVPSMQQVG